MSRISRYQESIDKFFKNKICSIYSVKNKIILDELYNEINHIIAIIFLTTLNRQCIKVNIKFHGYYIACGINILWLIIRLNESDINNNKQYNNFFLESQIIIYNLLHQNINTFQNINNNKILKIYYNAMLYLNIYILKCIAAHTYEYNSTILNHKLIYKFNNINNTYKQSQFKILNEDILNKYISDKYGSICSIAFILGWILAYGDVKYIPELENIGINFGYIIKIFTDFKNLEKDIELSKDFSTNIIINVGIVDSYILFIKKKTHFIEQTLSLKIYNIIIKELLDMIEKEIVNCLNKATIVLKN